MTHTNTHTQCLTDFCAQNTFINQNADVFAGFVGWAAGSFATSYVLSLTPTKQNNAYVDNQVMQQCLIDVWNSTVSTATASGSAAAAASTMSGSRSTVYSTPVVTKTVPQGSAATGETSTVDLATAMSGTDGGGLLTATATPTATGGGGALLTATSGSNSTTTRSSASSTAVVTSSGSRAISRGTSLAMAMFLAAATALIFGR